MAKEKTRYFKMINSSTGFTMFRENLRNKIIEAELDIGYKNYLVIREYVLSILDDTYYDEHPSLYWEEELAGFEYIFDASPLIIQKLREHCYHITGIRSYDYRAHHQAQQVAFQTKLDLLRKLDTHDLFVPESPLLGGFGFIIDHQLINLDTLKFYESLIALCKAGALDTLITNNDKRQIVIEIGAGWGGFAYQFKTLFPNTCYVIVDLPQTMMFSGVYLKTLFPNASYLFYKRGVSEQLSGDYCDYDFIFVPNFLYHNLKFSNIDLAINIASFQEMTSEQVEQYIQGLSRQCCKTVYSHNRDKSPHNNQLSAVSLILKKYYEIEELKVLGIPYTILPSNQKSRSNTIINSLKMSKALIRKLFPKKSTYNTNNFSKEYRHLVGKQRNRDT